MKKIYLTIFVCCFTASIFAQEKSNTIRENDQIESPEQVKIEQVSKIQQSNAAATVVSYDFTTGSDKYYGGAAAAVEVETGVWAMIAGDANGSGTVNTTDYLIVQPQINTSGYQGSDVNLSGTTNTTDYLVIQPNINKVSQVP